MKNLQQESINSEAAEKYKTLIEHSLSAFFLTTPEGNILETNNAAVRMFGYTAAEFNTILQQDIIDHNDDKLKAGLKEQERKGYTETEGIGIKKNGQRFFIDIFSTVFTNAVGQLRVSTLITDINETYRLRELEKIEKKVLENNTQPDNKIEDTLNYYLSSIEKVHPGMYCSVLMLQGNKLYNCAAPSLPENYCAAIEGLPIGENAGSCGTAAYTKQKTIVTDIEHDSRWAAYKHYALKEGLQSCWSFPVLNSKEEVMATFAIYHKTKRTPGNEEEKTIERARNILAIILENKMSEGLLKISVESYRYLFNNNPSSIIIWDISTLKIIEVNETATAVYGYPREEFLQLTVNDIFPPGEENIILEKQGSHINLTNPVQCRHITKTGTRIITELSLHTIIYNYKKAMLALGNDVTEKIQLENSLIEERKIRQQQITDAVITGQEKERVEIGQELHDNINQILATSKIYLEFALKNVKKQPELILESKILTERAMMEIRKLSYSLLPPSLNEIGLLEALNDLVESIESARLIKIKPDWKQFDETILSKKLKLTFFRIVQEQLNNIIKHAHANTAFITVTAKNNTACLEIRDDGIGFDPSKRKTGVGLKNIISRSEVNNGTVNIISKPGEGCVLTVCFILIEPNVTS
jgi:PAS domain S-box-containing protein